MIGLLSFLFGDNIAERASRFTLSMGKISRWKAEDAQNEAIGLPRRSFWRAEKDARYCFWANIESPVVRLAIYRAAATELGHIDLRVSRKESSYKIGDEEEKETISYREMRMLEKRLREMVKNDWAELYDGTRDIRNPTRILLYQIDFEFAEAICGEPKESESVWLRIKRIFAKRWKTPRNLSRRDERDSR